MRASVRSSRMARHQHRMRTNSKLNLVSLMDIFTILVFFLLVNSSDVEVLQTDKNIKLPESIAEQKPDQTIVVKVNGTDLLVGGRTLAKVADIVASDEVEIIELKEELVYQAERRPELTEREKEQGRAVTIMGDKAVPYQILKKIMYTCVANEFRHISLAVNQMPSDDSLLLEETVDVAAISNGLGG